MLPSINCVFRLSRDPELKYLPSGVEILTLGLACSQKRKDQGGNLKEESLFIDGKLFGKRAGTLASWMHKGSQVYIKGTLKFEQWQDQGGNNRSKHTLLIEDIELLDKKSDSQNQNSGSRGYHGQEYANREVPKQDFDPSKPDPSMNQSIPEIDIQEDGIPF